MNTCDKTTVLPMEESDISSDCTHAIHNCAQERLALRGHSVAPPLYKGRPDHYCPKTASVTVNLADDLCGLLLRVTKGEPLLHYAALAAATSACLYRYAQTSPITLGSPAMRPQRETAPSENVAVLVTDIAADMSFRQLLLNVREALLQDQETSYPLAVILEEAHKTASENRCPLFDVALVITDLHPAMPEPRHDVTLTFNQHAKASLQAAFSPELYEPETIQRFCQHILQILQSGLGNPSEVISQLTLLTEQEKQMLAIEWNATAADYPKDRCVHQLFEDQVVRSPYKTALVCGSQRLTYRELDERANQVAHYLRRSNIAPDTPIGIFLNRSVEQVIGLLGILKAGAAYVPYDVAYPKDRLAAMFEDLKPKIILTSERLINRLPNAGIPQICLDREAHAIARESTEKPDVHPATSHLCYIIFTSGSTGRAKATGVCHGGWMNLLNWFVQRFEVLPVDRTLVMSSISFDITQRSMAMPLISGGELHLVASDYFDPELILNTIDAEKITLMSYAPSTFYPLVEGPEAAGGYTRLRSLRWLFPGGEAISASRLRAWATSTDCKAQIANVYGVAECSDVSSYYILDNFDRYIKSSVPIGKPIYNTQIYLLDECLQLVPVGVAGEICIAGAGVGKGYINDPELTAKKFPLNPFTAEPNNRIYRTGDLARYLPDGNLEFVGRVDNQVKIRGQRVELGEIETILRQQASVKEAIVIQSQFSADQRLVAYIVPSQPVDISAQPQLIDELRAIITAELPQYMVPNAFVVLDEMPLNPNGKIDRGSLPQPAVIRGTTVSDPPQTEIERVLAAMFAKVLGAEGVGINDNFFNLGGHSLLVTQVLANIGKTFNVEFQAIDFYREPTVAGIAGHIDAAFKTQNQL